MGRKDGITRSWIALLLVLVLSVFGINGGFAQVSISAAEKIEVTSLKLTAGSSANMAKKTYSMTAGEKVTIKVTTKPSAAAKNAKFKSNNKSVATVTKSGVITAKKAGAANITVAHK